MIKGVLGDLLPETAVDPDNAGCTCTCTCNTRDASTTGAGAGFDKGQAT